MISKKAQIGTNCKFGEGAVINDDVIIGNNVTIGAHCLIDNGARISDDVQIHHGAIISSPPQDLKFKGEETQLYIGKGTVVREYATLNRGTAASGKTVIGENCLFMAYSHAAHDTRIGNNVVMANCASAAGHVEIGNWVIVGGLSGIKQFTKIGDHALITGVVLIVKDIPPFIIAGGTDMKYHGLNVIGLHRRGFSQERINKIKSVYDVIYNASLNFSDAVKKIKDEIEPDEDVNYILNFIEHSKYGIIKG
ncbi:MAG TPA: acyl-ACP--UDP-N-acetylglucosamine O-acyltransferase [Ignavibacteria bacterium]|nr:acyl-ACP--UDP-N-acetylglucosamine O-acyltransferase [Ignavibacteria bacterium]